MMDPLGLVLFLQQQGLQNTFFVTE